jgi:hypothetical protein
MTALTTDFEAKWLFVYAYDFFTSAAAAPATSLKSCSSVAEYR